jgi:hypothetical protein
MITKRNKFLYDVSIPDSGPLGSKNIYINLDDLGLPGGNFDNSKCSYIIDSTALNLNTFSAGSTRAWAGFAVAGSSRRAWSGLQEVSGIIIITYSSDNGQSISVSGYTGADAVFNDEYFFYRPFKGTVSGGGGPGTKSFSANSSFNIYFNEARDKMIARSSSSAWEIYRSGSQLTPSDGGLFAALSTTSATSASEVKDSAQSPEESSFTQGTYVPGPAIVNINLESVLPGSEVKLTVDITGYSED